MDGSNKGTSKLGNYGIILLGLGKCLASHTTFWNMGLGMGVVPFFLTNCYWSIGIICMSLCMAEMSSALPFTGGIYGFVRGLIGPYLGFFVGIFEIIGSVTLISVFLITFAASVNTALGLPEFAQLLFVPIPLILTAILQYQGRQRFCNVVMGITCIGLLLFVVYILGSLAFVDHAEYGNNTSARPPSQTYKLMTIIQCANYGTFFFVGIETLPVVSSEALKPNSAIPISLLTSTAFYIVSFICIIFLSCWQYPGTRQVKLADLPLSFGYANIFNISPEAAAIFHVPAALASISITVYYTCVNIRSMSLSGLLPSYLSRTTGEREVPANALLAICAVSISLTAVLLIGLVTYPAMLWGIFIFSTYGLHFCFFAIFAAYIEFRARYDDKTHAFRNPFGVWSAYLGIFILLPLPFLNNFPWHPYMVPPLLGFIGLMIALTVLYVRYTSHGQRFSPEEEKVFFVAFVKRANQRHKEHLKNKGRHSSHLPVSLLSQVFGRSSRSTIPQLSLRSPHSGGAESICNSPCGSLYSESVHPLPPPATKSGQMWRLTDLLASSLNRHHHSSNYNNRSDDASGTTSQAATPSMRRQQQPAPRTSNIESPSTTTTTPAVFNESVISSSVSLTSFSTVAIHPESNFNPPHDELSDMAVVRKMPKKSMRASWSAKLNAQLMDLSIDTLIPQDPRDRYADMSPRSLRCIVDTRIEQTQTQSSSSIPFTSSKMSTVTMVTTSYEVKREADSVLPFNHHDDHDDAIN